MPVPAKGTLTEKEKLGTRANSRTLPPDRAMLTRTQNNIIVW